MQGRGSKWKGWDGGVNLSPSHPKNKSRLGGGGVVWKWSAKNWGGAHAFTSVMCIILSGVGGWHCRIVETVTLGIRNKIAVHWPIWTHERIDTLPPPLSFWGYLQLKQLFSQYDLRFRQIEKTEVNTNGNFHHNFLYTPSNLWFHWI